MASIFFVHVPKTAGTSIRKAIFDNNIPEEDHCKFTGIKNGLSQSSEMKLLSGHYPFGIHKVYRIKDPVYYLMLREPIDRTVSYYHFIREWSKKPGYEHPHAKDANSKTIEEFYGDPKFQNAQTKAVAGLFYSLLSRYIDVNKYMANSMLKKAKKNMEKRIYAFGLKERFDESVSLFAERSGFTPEVPEKHYMKTQNRPAVNSLPRNTFKILEKYNSLDIELYKFAQEKFDEQFR